MRRDKPGRPRKTKIRQAVVSLRKAGFSYTEVGERLNITRQLAQYYGQKLSLDRKMDRK